MERPLSLKRLSTKFASFGKKKNNEPQFDAFVSSIPVDFQLIFENKGPALGKSIPNETSEFPLISTKGEPLLFVAQAREILQLEAILSKREQRDHLLQELDLLDKNLANQLRLCILIQRYEKKQDKKEKKGIHSQIVNDFMLEDAAFEVVGLYDKQKKSILNGNNLEEVKYQILDSVLCNELCKKVIQDLTEC